MMNQDDGRRRLSWLHVADGLAIGSELCAMARAPIAMAGALGGRGRLGAGRGLRFARGKGTLCNGTGACSNGFGCWRDVDG